MLCLVVTFGIHSFVDWTWYVPGVACVALLCAGWLAGRGPLGVPSGGRALRHAAAPSGCDRPRRRPRRERPPIGARPLRRCASQSDRRAPGSPRPSSSPRCSPRGRSGSRSARSMPPTKRSRPAITHRRSPRSPRRTPVSAAIRSPPKPAHARGGPGGRRPGGRRARHLRARRAPAALQLPDLARARRIRPARGQPRAALQALGATVYLNPESIARAPRSPTRRSYRSRTTTWRRCATSAAARAASTGRLVRRMTPPRVAS